MLSETDKYILNRCKGDKKFAKYYACYDQALDAALLVFNFRHKMHLSQQELANRANIPRSTVSRVEDGDMNPSMLTLAKIANSCHKHLKIKIK